MALIQTEKISRKFGDRIPLDEVSVSIESADRVALVGRNGSGKTTLLDILAGLTKPETGEVRRAKLLRVDYVEQELARYGGKSLREFVSEAREDLLSLEADLRSVELDLEHDPENSALISKYDKLQGEFTAGGGFDFQTEMELTLIGLGFVRDRFDAPLESFSGGEQNRAALARALLGNGNLLLLDEPTNHLDIQSTEWLEQKLMKSERAFVIVSHDRQFLAALVNTVWDLAFGKLDLYKENFLNFLTKNVELRAQREREYRRQREKIEKTEAFIRKNLAGQKTKQAQSRRKQLARMTKLNAPTGEESSAKMNLKVSGRSFTQVVSVENLSIGYDSQALISNINFDLYRGETVGLIGQNGSGKSTLIRTILGQLERLSGNIQIGSKVDIAYFDQNLGNVDETRAPIEHLWEIDPLADQGKVRSYLARFGFYGDETLKPAGALSGGEKTKLSLACLMYTPCNLIIFDEPTNHLDLQSREALEVALNEYEGACLVVSHDRYFLNQVSRKILAIDDGQLRVYDGSFDYYLRKKAESDSISVPNGKKDNSEYQNFKELSKRKAQLEKNIKSIAGKIADNERELVEFERLLENGIPKSDWEKLTETSANKTEVEMNLLELYQEQADATEELERMRNANSTESAA